MAVWRGLDDHSEQVSRARFVVLAGIPQLIVAVLIGSSVCTLMAVMLRCVRRTDWDVLRGAIAWASKAP